MKLEKNWPNVFRFNAMPSKITQKKYQGQRFLLKFVSFLLHNTSGAFCIWANALSNIQHRIDLKQHYPLDLTPLRGMAVWFYLSAPEPYFQYEACEGMVDGYFRKSSGPGCSNVGQRYPPDKSPRMSIREANYSIQWIALSNVCTIVLCFNAFYQHCTRNLEA